MSRFPLLALIAPILAVPVGAAPVPKRPPPPLSWPMNGGSVGRNMANVRDVLPKLPTAAPDWDDEGAVKRWEAEWVLWTAELGSRSYGGPVVAGGKVYVGTNNERPRNPRDRRIDAQGEVEKLDMGVLMCFDERTGKFLWQAVHDKLPNRNVTDWPKEGVCSTPTIVGDRVYYVSNRCTVVCLDANGFVDGNQGFQNEPYKDDTDADVIWEYDMIGELHVFPHNMSNCSPLVVEDRIFVCTSNGVDESHVNLPAPHAPSLICLDRHTGKLLWRDNSPGEDIMHAQWSSPAYASDPVPQVIQGQGDGWLRAFDPATGKLLWKFDCNRKGAVYELGGTGDKSDFIAMPVVYCGRVYIGPGQDPEHSTGIADLWCIDLTKAVELGARAPARDVSPDLLVRLEKPADPEERPKAVTKPNPASALAWNYGGEEKRRWAPRDFKFGRTMSTVAAVGDVVYAAELHGYLHCLNAKTGEHYWQYDTKASIWGSPYFVDGRVLVGTDAGDLFVFRHDPKPRVIDELNFAADNLAEAKRQRRERRDHVEKQYLLAKIELPAAIRTTPVVADGVLYVTTENTLYALGKK
jgi:outer membrane protein assembly factor BamB